MDQLTMAVSNFSIMFSVFVILWILKQCLLGIIWISRKLFEYDKYIEKLLEHDKERPEK